MEKILISGLSQVGTTWLGGRVITRPTWMKWASGWVGRSPPSPPQKECFFPIRYFSNTLPHITLATPRAVTNGVLLSGILPSHLFTSVMSNSPVWEIFGSCTFYIIPFFGGLGVGRDGTISKWRRTNSTEKESCLQAEIINAIQTSPAFMLKMVRITHSVTPQSN